MTAAAGPTAVLLLSCDDQPGLVATIAEFVFRSGGNVLHADQHIDRESNTFFQRIEFTLDGFAFARDEIEPALLPTFERFGIRHALRFSDEQPRVAILVSKELHCLHDLLNRWQLRELRGGVELVIGNHPEFLAGVEHLGVEAHCLPVTPGTKGEQEVQVLALLDARAVDLVVLARYMQVLSPAFVHRYRDRLVNIHHSFLPAFVGATPYRQAHERGVKLIGATAHYATEELDEGPIIEQDVVRVTHRDSVDDLVRKGRDLERVVLARAVRAHLEHRVLVYGRKTVVFD